MSSELLKILNSAHQIKMICVGDVMLDQFVYGTVKRISREAPVPVLAETHRQTVPGGAGNVVRNASALGVRIKVIGVIGDDEEGELLRQRFSEIPRVENDLIVETKRTTTVKTRYVAGSQHLLKLDSKSGISIKPETEERIIATLDRYSSSVDSILVSDYGNGCVTEKVMVAVRRLANRFGAKILVDPKGNDYRKYGEVDLIKPNNAELGVVTGLPYYDDDEIHAGLKRLFETSFTKSIVVTRAEKGMSYSERGGQVSHLQGVARDVYDVSGAGDTCLVSIGLGLSVNSDLRTAVELAVKVSGIAVGKKGTSIVTTNEIVEHLNPGHRRRSSTDLDQLLILVGQWREEELVVGFTNGCFDILHPGHLAVLTEAREKCDRLIVGLNSDASTRRLKGFERPVNTEEDRATMLNGFAFVDAVTIFEEDTPARLISAIRPNIYIKGGDYTIEDLEEAKLVMGYGGKVHLVDFMKDHSTTSLIEKVRQ